MSRNEEDDSSSGESSEEEEDDDNLVESLVAGRERRSTAGRWLGNLVAKAAADDAEQEDVERTLDDIFDEGIPEEDVDFEEDAAADDRDMAMSESDSGEDAGPGQGEDEMEGERQLLKAERAEKLAKKRKARDAMVAPLIHPKKIKTAPLVSAPESQPTARPRIPKKSERQSWLPTDLDAPIRASTRTQTVRNKVTVHARMRESEKRRQRTINSMEAAARRKFRNEQPPKTQEQRLAEAALVERKNSRSLNRWQLAEDQRQAEQKAKLEALRSKKLEGPVISWYSGPGYWVNGLLKGTGKDFKIEEVHEPADVKVTPMGTQSNESDGSVRPPQTQSHAPLGDSVTQDSGTQSQGKENQGQTESRQTSHLHDSDQPQAPTSLQTSNNLLHGIYDYANLPYQDQPPEPSLTQPAPPQASPPIQLPLRTSPAPPTTLQPAPTIVDIALRSLIIMSNFPDFERTTRAVDRHEAVRGILLHTSKTKTTKPKPIMCAITDHPARYLDPKTRLPYSSLYSYRFLRKILEGRCVWSSLLGCFVGPEYELPHGKPAAGVPERFGQRRRRGEKRVKVEEGSGG
ncbi:hypothetical protein EV356DRAFT_504885 [Viridothelium virens]|uniref:Vps72/YL1 C-terminal domain-containing protein n=1 Tax=Viridothelium virens TaxID=1048519 RepID=A0A6A6H544_VIRVR|nr:hypothetical protein EV356DRAFT_504885 [Viridothelium virens]